MKLPKTYAVPPLTLQSRPDVKCNMRIKVYPDGSRRALIFSVDAYTPDGWEASAEFADRSGVIEPPPDVGEMSVYELERMDAKKAYNVGRSRRRAKERVRDIAMSTDFRWFVTLALDPAKVDRYDMAAITKKLNVWLSNAVRRQGLAYVLVPEHHKDGAIHFHGFFNDALPVEYSHTLTNGGRPRRPASPEQEAEWLSSGWHKVYNLPRWTLGFSTAIELYGERRHSVGYVLKYIDKEYGGTDSASAGKIGGRYYYSGGKLGAPEILYAECYDFDRVEGFEFAVPGLGCRAKIVEYDPAGNVTNL